MEVNFRGIYAVVKTYFVFTWLRRIFGAWEGGVIMRLLITLITITAFVPSVALADVVPTEEWVCRGLEKGEKCSLSDSSRKGTCQDSTCSRSDYSHGTPPTSVEYDCLKCLDENGVVPSGITSDDTSGGCNVVPGTSTFNEVGALVLAGSFSLLFFLRRRRHRQ
jgi:hypothetical protein